jgi:hypothetical protein
MRVSKPILGPTQPHVQWGLETLSAVIMRPEHDADHSPSPRAVVKSTWNFTSISP